MAGLITVAELVARPGFEDADTSKLQGSIDDASALVRSAAGTLLDDVESPDTPPAVVAVLVNMIRRGTYNPMGHQSETLGDYSYAANPTGGVATLYLTSRERKIVRKAVGKLGARSVAMASDLPVQASDDYFGLAGTLDEGIEL